MQQESFYLSEYEKECEEYRNKISLIYKEYEDIISEEINSELTGVDYAFAIMVGVAGAVLTNSKNVQKVLDEIHQIASAPKKKNDTVFQSIIKTLLGHYQLNIDTMPIGQNGQRVFPTRSGGASRSGPHRIFGGHDILSFNRDNPFALMIEQTGSVTKGIIAALKHLTADTFSKQGLPVPTSSWWDYTYADGKKVGNKLLDFCNRLYDEAAYKTGKTGGNNEIFNHMFSIHIQDMTAQTLGSALCKSYMKYRHIRDKVIEHQFLLIAYAVMFYLNCFLGFARTGIFYINWCAGICMIKEYILMYTNSWWEVKKLEKLTAKSIERSDVVEQLARKQLDNYQDCMEKSLTDKIKNYI